MSKKAFEVLIAIVFVSTLIVGSPTFSTTNADAAGKNTLNFSNKSASHAIVRVFDDSSRKRIAEVRVKNGLTRGTSIADGHYYIVAKFMPESTKPGTASPTYARGQPFTIKPPKGKRAKVTITLHRVVDGNYSIVPADENAFEK